MLAAHLAFGVALGLARDLAEQLPIRAVHPDLQDHADAVSLID